MEREAKVEPKPNDFKTLSFSYGIVMLRTGRFQSLMDRLGKSRFASRFGWAMLYLMPVAAAAGMYLLLMQMAVLLSPTSAVQAGSALRGTSPLGLLAVPGINPYLPIVDGWVALFFAMIIHEGAHGVIARSCGLPVRSAGLMFFLVIPIGAFVDVEEKPLKETSFKNSGRVLAGGAGVNFVVGLVLLLLMLNIVSTMTPAANGIGITYVDKSSPAGLAGLRQGDFITAVNGVAPNDNFSAAHGYVPDESVNLTISRAGSTFNIDNLKLAASPNNTTVAYLGISTVSSTALKGQVSSYGRLLYTKPVVYLCIPTIPRCAGVPFGPTLAPLYVSSYGPSFESLITLVYWLFYINFNLAIFNAIPLYPLDGGQAFKLGLRSATKGKLSAKAVDRITVVVSLTCLALLLVLPIAAYAGLV